VCFQWRWYYPAASVGLWVLIVLLLVLVKRTRTARAWLILLALVLAIVLWQMEGLSPLFVSLGAAWIIVWRLGGWLSRGRLLHTVPLGGPSLSG
jgi:membrane-bound ClpP family serine protease